MKRHMTACVAVTLMACVLPLFAQSTAAGIDPLSRLLVEVHALRVAVERSASATPQVQLLSARLTVENERLTRAAREADAAHVELGNLQRSVASLGADLAETEEALSHETDPAKQQALKQNGLLAKERLEASVAAEARLRVRDTDFANALAGEQAQWIELNRRLDELERQLSVRPPQ